MSDMSNKIFYYLEKIKKIQNKEFIPPISCEIDPTNMCNAKCSWCMFHKYREASSVHLKWDIYLKLIYELKFLGVKSITFTGGGEPLMNPRFNQMVEVANDLKFEVGLVTNGILLHKLKQPEYFKFIRVSLDASNAEMYQKVKGVDKFDVVIKNIEKTLKRNETVGLSYVVGPDNNYDFDKAREISNKLGAAYIQIKPMYVDDGIFDDYKLKNFRNTVIETTRYKPSEKLPCHIAHLVGIIAADGCVYYCCQGRGKPNFFVGSLAHESFETIWRRRLKHNNISIRQCPPCRYMNYASAVRGFLKEGNLFYQHKNFL